MTEEIIDRVTKMIAPILSEEGMECVDLQYRREQQGWVLRLYIDKEGGVTLDDCTRINQKVGRILDVEDPIEVPYHLEVSSPGLTRPLKTEKDFLRYQNRLIQVKTFEPIQNRRHFKGRLLRVSSEEIELHVDGEIFHIPFQAISKARLELEF
jgi:ribosome maturation factor RimP